MAKSTKKNIGALAIVGLLSIGLLGFGVTNFGGSGATIGTVGDREITAQDYARALEGRLRQLSQDMGRNVTLSEAQSVGIDRAVLGALVAEAAYAEEAARLGLSVGDEAVRDQVVTTQAFRGFEGGFDRETYARSLRRIGLTEAEYEARIRASIAARIIESAIAGGAQPAPAFTDAVYDYVRETRTVSWALLTPATTEPPALPEPSGEDLQTFYDENPDVFTRPETRRITYAWLTPEMMLDEIEVPEAALRELYEANLSDYVQPERRLVERLVLGTDAAADEAARRLADGEATFDDLVAERELELEDVDMGDVARDELGEAGEAIFALEEPGVTSPLPSPLGPAIYRVNAILAATEVSFEEARDELTLEYSADRARRAIDGLRDDLDDQLAGGATLEDLAAETAMELGEIGWHRGVEGGIADYEAFRSAARQVQEGDYPELLTFDNDGGLFALRLDETVAPELPAFDEVRDEVIAAWETDAEARAFVTLAQETAAALEAGDEPGAEQEDAGGAGEETPAAADEPDVTLTEVAGLLRSGTLNGAPTSVVQGIFEMSEGDLRVFEVPDGAALVRLDAIVPADPDAPEGEVLKQAFAQAAGQAMAEDLMALFGRSLERSLGVSVNQAAINAVNAQFPQ